MRYDRNLAVSYAREWAMRRNPKYYNYDKLGGDCTNFISQCLFEGIGEMNYRGYGWYYKDANRKSPSWTGVEYLYDFLINNKYEGPRGKIVLKEEIEIGDIIQLSFDGNIYGHTLFVSDVSGNEIKVCSHTIDSKDRLLDTYNYNKIRFIKIS